MKWTNEQQQAIEIRNKNMLVAAAAGSGKTAVLVERIKQIIISDQIPITNMLVVTFSNAAASEMKEKIAESFSKELDEISDIPTEKQSEDTRKKQAFLREQLNFIQRANISTFHAFSMEVIKRYFYLIDIEPNFKICDEAQKTILQAEAMEQLFRQYFDLKEPKFIDFLFKYATAKNEEAVKQMIYEAHNFIQSIPDSMSWLRAKAGELCCSKEEFLKSQTFSEIKGDIKRKLFVSLKYFEKIWELLNEYQIESLCEKAQSNAKLVKGLIDSIETDSMEIFSENINNIKFQSLTASKADKENYEPIKEGIAALRKKGGDIIKNISSTYFARSIDEYVSDINKTHQEAVFLCELVSQFDQIYKDKKRKKGLLDFSDIEHYALDILSFDEAAKEYANKFDYIFIDEYQDSNVVQETLIGKIKRDNNLFMVGDVKQSIYKFRLAEPEIFIRKYDDYKDARDDRNIKIDLNKNFRSKAGIISCVNDLFSQIMDKELSGIDYDEAAALYEGAPYEGERIYPVELYLADEKQIEELDIDDEIKEMKKAEIEASAAVQIIKNIKGTIFFDSKKCVEKEVENKDIVILLRSAKGLAEVYSEALEKEGINTYVDNSDGYFDTIEIEVFLNLLKIINNKRQDIQLLSVMRSPIFAFSIEELITIRLKSKDCSYYDAFEKYAEEGEKEDLREKCRESLEQLILWKKESSYMPLEDFLWLLLSKTGYYDYVGTITGGTQRQANIRALIDKAIQFQAGQMKGLYSFINYIEAIKKRKVAMGQVKLIGENDNVVRIMTVHKSKGLEFPVVLVGGLGKRFNRDSATYQMNLHKDIGLGMRLSYKENSCFRKTIVQTAIMQKKERESLAEELRILYVALTRAKDRLVLLGTLKDTDSALDKYDIKGNVDLSSGKSYFDFIIPSLEKTKIVVKRFDRADISYAKESDKKNKEKLKNLILDSEKTTSEFLESEIDLKEEYLEISRKLSYKYEFSKSVNIKSKFSASELSKIKDNKDFIADTNFEVKELAVPNFIKGEKRFSSAELGTILHKVMECLDFREKIDLKVFVDGLVKREILDEEEAKTINYKWIREFLNSDIGKRAAMSDEIHKEISFNLKKEILGEKVIVQGTIDCFFKENEEYVLIDYKSDYILNAEDNDPHYNEKLEEIKEKYKTQIEIYKEALERIKGIKVKETYLYLFSIGKAIKMNI